MQTFLPYPSFVDSAACLDRQRLGKQRVEAKQILIANSSGPVSEETGKKTPWYNHPAVRMWRGHDKALALYGMCVCQEWQHRGYRDNLHGWFYARFMYGIGTDAYPDWIGDEVVHASHRARLLDKDPDWYGQYGWAEKPRTGREGYVWPVRG